MTAIPTAPKPTAPAPVKARTPDRYSGRDVAQWRVVNVQGKTMRGKDGRLLSGFSGFSEANTQARKTGGRAVRV